MIVTGDPTQAVVDALLTTLRGDAALAALVTGIYGHLSEASRTAYPYLVIGRRHHDGTVGVVQRACGRITLQVDGWSAHKGASEMHAIHSRVYRVLERRLLSVLGFDVIEGSLTREWADVFDEPDEDNPDRRLYHGVQQWVCEVHEP